jgi:BirA family biotin operon repressor/biotin-[acetyl-CoA-carboxylase] ligase
MRKRVPFVLGAHSTSSQVPNFPNSDDELISPEKLSPLLRGTIFGGADSIHHFLTIHSTNSAAMQAAAAGAEEGAVFIAEEQLGGRGRGGHTWHSERGVGIYLSVVLRPRLEPTETLWLSLISGLAVHEAVKAVTGIAPDLRWPNDIIAGGKKLGGILTELSTEQCKVRHVVVGIGLNVNHAEFPAELRELATSLRIESCRKWPRVELVAALLKSLNREYGALQADADGSLKRSIISRFEERSSYARSAQVQVDDAGMGESASFSGVTAGLDARGFLLVQTPTGMRTVINGGVRKVGARV